MNRTTFPLRSRIHFGMVWCLFRKMYWMNVIYHHYGITECYNSIKKWKKKQTNSWTVWCTMWQQWIQEQKMSQRCAIGFRVSRMPIALMPLSSRNWFLTGPPLNTGGCVQQAPKHYPSIFRLSYVCEPALLSSTKRRFMLLGFWKEILLKKVRPSYHPH